MSGLDVSLLLCKGSFKVNNCAVSTYPYMK